MSIHLRVRSVSKPFLFFAAGIGLIAGCTNPPTTYTAPGKAADFRALEGVSSTQQSQPESAAAAMDKKPLAAFPVNVAVVHIQAPGYHSATDESIGGEDFSVVVSRDPNQQEKLEQLQSLPMVKGITMVSSLLIPDHFHGNIELRKAAADSHADLLLIYTFDTKFISQDVAAPLTMITFGASPTIKLQVSTTASAVLMDTRNGYIYGTTEATEHEDGLANAFGNAMAIDGIRQKTEAASFDKLMGNLRNLWGNVVKQYATPTTKPGM